MLVVCGGGPGKALVLDPRIAGVTHVGVEGGSEGQGTRR